MMYRYYMYNNGSMCDAFFAPSVSFCSLFKNINRLISTASAAVLLFVNAVIYNIINIDSYIIKGITICLRRIKSIYCKVSYN